MMTLSWKLFLMFVFAAAVGFELATRLAYEIGFEIELMTFWVSQPS